jgi:hypothetical protein
LKWIVGGTYNPATIGPKTGPRKTLAVNILIAGPLPAADHISATTPNRARINATFQWISKGTLTTTVRQRRHSKEACEKSSDEEGLHVLREPLPEMEQGIQSQGDDENRSSADELTSRSPEHRLDEEIIKVRCF